jgi:hypothetical protein
MINPKTKLDDVVSIRCDKRILASGIKELGIKWRKILINITKKLFFSIISVIIPSSLKTYPSILL